MLSERARVKPARVLARKDSSTQKNRFFVTFPIVKILLADSERELAVANSACQRLVSILALRLPKSSVASSGLCWTTTSTLRPCACVPAPRRCSQKSMLVDLLNRGIISAALGPRTFITFFTTCMMPLMVMHPSH